MKKIFSISVLLCSFFLFAGCEEEVTPTKIAMQGNWELVQATDASGTDITSKVAFPVTIIQLTDDNGMLGTQGPMFTRIVYGDSKWIEISAKIKQTFDYANFRFNTGEFFVGENVQERFTVEAKLQATAAAGDLKDILQVLGIQTSWLQQVVYHKFTNVKVSFDNTGKKKKEDKDQIMIWEFDDMTLGHYDYKDPQGNKVLWQGWPVENFSRGKFVWHKFTKGLNEAVNDHL